MQLPLTRARETPAGVTRETRAQWPQLRRIITWLSIATTVVMAIVLLQGTLVTNTGSQAGCGDSWPLCRGKIIPELSGVSGAATLIEFSHRLVVPLVSTMILVLAAGILVLWRHRLEARILAPAMIVLLLLQAVLGGLAVMYPTSAAVLALHFGISLLAFSSVMLTAAFLLEVGTSEVLRSAPISRDVRALIWGLFAFTYLQVYLGAYVRHAGASLACPDWPLCHGTVVPPLDQYVLAQLGHRFGAVLLTMFILWLWLAARRIRGLRPDVYKAASLAVILVMLQALSGGLVVLTQLTVVTTLLHSFLITLLFGTVSYLCYHAIPLPARSDIPIV